MLLNKINHIGVAVKSIEAALPFYKAMGADINHIEEVPSQKVKTAFIKVGETTIELVEATSCLAELKKAEVPLIDNEPKVGAHNMLVAFVHPKGNNGVLTELAQYQK